MQASVNAFAAPMLAMRDRAMQQQSNVFAPQQNALPGPAGAPASATSGAVAQGIVATANALGIDPVSACCVTCSAGAFAIAGAGSARKQTEASATVRPIVETGDFDGMAVLI